MKDTALLVLSFVVLGACCGAASDPAQRILDLNVQGVDAPSQTMEMSPTEIPAYGEHAVRHCFVFSTFAAFETETGQIGAESIVVRQRLQKETTADICSTEKRPGDRFMNGAEGFVLGARGSFLFVTTTDSSGSPGSVSIFDTQSGKKRFDVVRSDARPLTVNLEGGVVSLTYFAPLQLDCDLAVDSCWAKTLQNNHVPKESVLVRPDCGPRAENPKGVILSTPVHVNDLANPKLVYENGQPVCSHAP